MERSRQTLLDRWLQVIHNADEKRQFKCQSCDDDFFTQGGLDMHFKNAHTSKYDESFNDKNEPDVSHPKHPESSVQHKDKVELQFEVAQINDDV